MHAKHTTRSTTKKQKNEGPLGLLYVPSRVGIEKKLHVIISSICLSSFLHDFLELQVKFYFSSIFNRLS